jgi:hypothetical protein
MTVAAVIFGRAVDLKGQVGVQLANKEPGTRLFVNQVGMLADPAEPGFLCQGLFQYRCAVGKGAVTKRSGQGLDSGRQLLQSLADDFVIVTAQCIA